MSGKDFLKIEAYFPPGYEYGAEKNIAACLMVMGAGLSCQYFWKLYYMVQALYYIDRKLGRTLRPEAVAAPFLPMVSEYAWLFAPAYLFLLLTAIYHYLYFFQNTKSIYLMRRLPGRGKLFRACVQAPLLGMAACAVMMVLLCLLYYVIYLLAVPKECLPGFM